MDDLDAFVDALTVLFRGRVGDGLIRVFMMVQLQLHYAHTKNCFKRI